MTEEFAPSVPLHERIRQIAGHIGVERPIAARQLRAIADAMAAPSQEAMTSNLRNVVEDLVAAIDAMYESYEARGIPIRVAEARERAAAALAVETPAEPPYTPELHHALCVASLLPEQVSHAAHHSACVVLATEVQTYRGIYAKAEAARRAVKAGAPTADDDELNVKFPRAWASYLQAVILGAIGDMDGDGDCRWHLNELAKFLGRAAEKTPDDPHSDLPVETV